MYQDEAVLEALNRRFETSNGAGDSTCQFTQHQSELAERPGWSVRSEDAAGKALREVVRSRNRRPPVLVDVLTKHDFLSELGREQRRADRATRSLSIVMCCLEHKSSGALDRVEELLQLLCRGKRETDFVGYLNEHVVALALPDTNEAGAQGVIERIRKPNGDLPFSTIIRTYPHENFDCLASDSQETLDAYTSSLHCVQEPGGYARVIKRAIDIVGAIAGILVFSPLMLITALAIKLTDSGPAIFRQVRLGRKGVPFVFYKFRSMYLNVDDRIHREYVANLIKGNLDGINQGCPEKPVYKMRSDPRITRIGRFIRKTSIDELPQLFNVLKGDMSLVGPRPPLPYEAEKYQPWHLRRIIETKPGITGLWQVEGRSRVSFDEMVRLDLRYARNWSLMLDLWILVKTVRAVLQCDGAD